MGWQAAKAIERFDPEGDKISRGGVEIARAAGRTTRKEPQRALGVEAAVSGSRAPKTGGCGAEGPNGWRDRVEGGEVAGQER